VITSLEQYVGQTLDDKYRLERLLGKGGMGGVYLATHLGTERYVALKLIAPQFMRNPEFVERFKREARAAGRLRHPNVVDVTDFGFSGTGNERVAYLVMEYLDGCTLSDVLAEETRLPLYWAVDILEQVSSAVHEAHLQGIVHRDLKPDNIWLEPNRLGGYRVKVLDFGIAKLAEQASDALAELPSFAEPASEALTLTPETVAAAAGHVLAPPDLESATLIDPSRASEASGDGVDGPGTQLLNREAKHTAAPVKSQTHAASTSGTAGLTRVGAILGTPLYMSPEQCRGEALDARSDIYSLGVIAYQTLAGTPPFTGETPSIIKAHNELQPAALKLQNRKLPKRVSRVVMSALAKDPGARPPSAAAFANELRANSDRLGALYRRAFALYSEYFPKFLKLSLLAHIPVIIVTILAVLLRAFETQLGKGWMIALGIPLALLQICATFVTGSTISGVTAIMVTQLEVAPLKPVELRAAFRVFRARWRPFLRTAIRVIARIIIGFVLLIIPGIVVAIRYFLWAPVVLLEGIENKPALKRARALASRSWGTIIIALVVQFLVPSIVGGIIGAAIGATNKVEAHKLTIKISAQFSSLINIFIMPLLAIVPALLYLKMRQLGGETVNDVISQIEDVEGARSLWQQRMRTRLNVTPQTRTPI
jgi:serine/threonine protein kinase